MLSCLGGLFIYCDGIDEYLDSFVAKTAKVWNNFNFIFYIYIYIYICCIAFDRKCESCLNSLGFGFFMVRKNSKQCKKLAC